MYDISNNLFEPSKRNITSQIRYVHLGVMYVFEKHTYGAQTLIYKWLSDSGQYCTQKIGFEVIGRSGYRGDDRYRGVI